MVSDVYLQAHVRLPDQFLVPAFRLYASPDSRRCGDLKKIISCIHLTCCNKLLQHSEFSAGLFFKSVLKETSSDKKEANLVGF